MQNPNYATYDDVVKAVENMIEKGVEPTFQAVKAHFGNRGDTLILSHLDKMRKNGLPIFLPSDNKSKKEVELDAAQSDTIYVLDTNILIHDPNAILNFDEHTVVIPMTALEELDNLKSGKTSVSAECRQAIRLIDKMLGDATPAQIQTGVPINREGVFKGHLSIKENIGTYDESELNLSSRANDNRIINLTQSLKKSPTNNSPGNHVVLVSKDINMRLKARAQGIEAEDYHSDQLIDDVDLLPKGYHEFEDNLWNLVSDVSTESRRHPEHQRHTCVFNNPVNLQVNDYLIHTGDFVGVVRQIEGDKVTFEEIGTATMMNLEAWGLKPRDIYQAIALHSLLDPEIHLVTLNGSAGSGKTILALAAAIEQTMVTKSYNKIIVTRSIQGVDEDIGFLPGTEKEKMEPWLGAITDNLEALHADDESTQGSIDYIFERIPLQFKSLNYIRGRSFQHSFILIDEAQNLTPHQMKTIITRAGNGSKVICLGNLAQIDTPYLSAPSSGLTYLTERFKGFDKGAQVTLQGVPRSALAEYAESHL